MVWTKIWTKRRSVLQGVWVHCDIIVVYGYRCTEQTSDCTQHWYNKCETFNWRGQRNAPSQPDIKLLLYRNITVCQLFLVLLPCGWCQQSAGAGCHRGSGRADRTSSHGPGPCGSPGIGWHPSTPSPDTLKRMQEWKEIKLGMNKRQKCSKGGDKGTVPNRKKQSKQRDRERREEKRLTGKWGMALKKKKSQRKETTSS